MCQETRQCANKEKLVNVDSKYFNITVSRGRKKGCLQGGYLLYIYLRYNVFIIDI